MTLHETPSDPRTRRTLALLERAMSSLLETQSITDINVSELCRVAGIHRTTFYKHFSSVVDEQLPPSAEEVPEHYRRALQGMLDHIAQNRRAYRRLFASGGDHQFQRIVADVLTTRAHEAHERLVARGREIPIDAETGARIVGAACAGAMGVWAEQDAVDSEQRSREIMSALPPWWRGR